MESRTLRSVMDSHANSYPIVIAVRVWNVTDNLLQFLGRYVHLIPANAGASVGCALEHVE